MEPTVLYAVIAVVIITAIVVPILCVLLYVFGFYMYISSYFEDTEKKHQKHQHDKKYRQPEAVVVHEKKHRRAKKTEPKRSRTTPAHADHKPEKSSKRKDERPSEESTKSYKTGGYQRDRAEGDSGSESDRTSPKRTGPGGDDSGEEHSRKKRTTNQESSRRRHRSAKNDGDSE
ncbi:unnamed protein product [Anisakis simplex]|uniref:Uncharacterized protein n=1 Tax=Anisakis simplex TaxID=6269 RepID=A0A0M3KA67_ANISI|nr:unnamed protein product [Anisakis simplex]